MQAPKHLLATLATSLAAALWIALLIVLALPFWTLGLVFIWLGILLVGFGYVVRDALESAGNYIEKHLN
jgi:type IV secretory pathway TraG/TraD family ATPase VirD4